MCVCVCVCVCAHMRALSHFSRIRLFVTPWTVAHQAPLSMGCSRQKYWSGLPFPSPGDLPNPGIKPTTLECPMLAGGFFTTSTTWEAPFWEEALSSKVFQQSAGRSKILPESLLFPAQYNPHAKEIHLQFSSVQFSHSVVSDSLRPHELQHARPPCPSPSPGVHSDSRPSSP